MQKLSGGNALECGHSQVISSFRYAAYQTGHNQRPVWCVECSNWVNVLPNPSIKEESDIVDKSDNSVLELL